MDGNEEVLGGVILTTLEVCVRVIPRIADAFGLNEASAVRLDDVVDDDVVIFGAVPDVARKAANLFGVESDCVLESD